MAAVDFGTEGSPVAAGYTRFVASEGASQTVAGVGIQIQSKNFDIVAGTGASGDNLTEDYAATTFSGGVGNYISVILTGLTWSAGPGPKAESMESVYPKTPKPSPAILK